MKKFLLFSLTLAFLLGGCSPTAENNGNNGSAQQQNPDAGKKPGENDGKDPKDDEPVTTEPELTPFQLQYNKCKANPTSHENCACIVDKESLECKCKGQPGLEICQCLKTPGLDMCACFVDPDSEQCHCNNNPDAPDCAKESAYDFCVRFCANDASKTELMEEAIKDYADADCDSDGLTNEQESMMSPVPTDLCAYDSDGDSLTDYEEVTIYKSDPWLQDSDGDGISDSDEVKFGLDPGNPETIPGKRDGDQWVTTACDQLKANLSLSQMGTLKSSSKANLQFSLPTGVKGKELSLTNSVPNKELAFLGIFDDTANEISGGIISMRLEDDSVVGAPGALNVLRDNTMRAGLSIIFNNQFVGGEAKTHDEQEFARGDFDISANKAMAIGTFRQKLVLALTGWNSNAIDGAFYPVSATRYERFALRITTVVRNLHAGGRQLIIIYTVAPFDRVESSDLTRFRTEDLTNTTALAAEESTIMTDCKVQAASIERPKADFYLIIDESGSMDEEIDVVKAVSADLWEKLQNADLDYRVGISPIDKSSAIGKSVGRTNPGRILFRWSNQKTYFDQSLNAIVQDRTAGVEEGLEIGKQGILHMKNTTDVNFRIRDDAALITVWMTDEGEANWDSANKRLSDYINFYKQHSVCFAIVPEGDGPFPASQPVRVYRDVAQATGGAYAVLPALNSKSQVPAAAKKIGPTINAIIEAAAGLSSNFELGQTPISSTLQVYKSNSKVDFQYIQRSRTDGFDYNPQTNTLSFFGDARPSRVSGTENESEDRYVIFYRYYVTDAKDPF